MADKNLYFVWFRKADGNKSGVVVEADRPTRACEAASKLGDVINSRNIPRVSQMYVNTIGNPLVPTIKG